MLRRPRMTSSNFIVAFPVIGARYAFSLTALVLSIAFPRDGSPGFRSTRVLTLAQNHVGANAGRLDYAGIAAEPCIGGGQIKPWDRRARRAERVLPDRGRRGWRKTVDGAIRRVEILPDRQRAVERGRHHGVA